MHQQIEHLGDISPFGRTGIKLSVRKCTRPAFAITVVGVGIYHPFGRKEGHIGLALVDILAPFKDDGPESEPYEFKGGKKSGWPCPHNSYGRSGADISKLGLLVRNIFLIRAIGLIFIPPYRLFAGVYRALFEHPFHPCGLGLYLFETGLPRKGIYDFEFFHP